MIKIFNSKGFQLMLGILIAVSAVNYSIQGFLSETLKFVAIAISIGSLWYLSDNLFGKRTRVLSKSWGSKNAI